MDTTLAGAAKNTLLFIPDISGFTQFVNQTEIQHSQHIIEELLEILIDSNGTGLQVSEIEGDAVFFLREGPAPTAAEMLAQVQKMYVRFHAHLKKYANQRICQCGACSTADGLALKFFGHYGPVSINKVKEHLKPFGRDVIVIHRLTKNGIDRKEYVLLTDSLTQACASGGDIERLAWSTPIRAEESYDLGSVGFQYLPLEPLMRHVPEPALADHGIAGATDHLMTNELVIEAPMELVFDVISDLSFRHHWMVTLVGSDQINHKINQPGSTHRCLIKHDASDPVLVAHDFKVEQDLITFVESNHRDGIAAVYFLRRVGKGLTKVEMALFWKSQVFKKLMFDLFMKKKIAKICDTSLVQLGDYCKKLALGNQVHPNRIELGLPTSQ